MHVWERPMCGENLRSPSGEPYTRKPFAFSYSSNFKLVENNVLIQLIDFYWLSKQTK